jgi:alpha-methylacyl-CoA racemase
MAAGLGGGRVGQVVDAAIIDGVTSMMTGLAGLVPSGRISLDHERNPLGGAAPFYCCYLCADGRQISIGPIEPRFYTQLVAAIGAPDRLQADSNDERQWAEHSSVSENIFRSRTADEWRVLLEGTDVSFAPVLHLSEAPDHAQLKERGTYVEHEGRLQLRPGDFREHQGRFRALATSGKFSRAGSGVDRRYVVAPRSRNPVKKRRLIFS